MDLVTKIIIVKIEWAFGKKILPVNMIIVHLYLKLVTVDIKFKNSHFCD